MAQRYCTNCGNDLGPNDAFCGSCGKPTHETAAVATPEANVDVPPPPGASANDAGSTTAGAPGIPSATSVEGEQPKRRGCIFYLVVTVVILFVLVQIVNLGGNEQGGSGGSGGGNRAAAPAANGQGGQAADREPAPEQEPEAEPEPAPEPEPDPINLSGNASQATDFFELEEGLAVFDFSHQGQANFIATLVDEQGTEVGYALGNEIGTVEPSSALRIPQAGRYVLDVDADGPWSTEVTQPRPADAPEKTAFSGDNNAATPLFFTGSGLKRVTATHQGQGNFIVSMLDAEGRETAFAMVNEIGSGEFSTTVTVPQDGLYLFTVEAEGPWTIDIE